ncbi:DUF2538 family protein [Virgibacillus sp. AGTR]|uniref:DUF2538 family protein n=1 Tax=Virgibacillus sp. AGTR TaxID=2812055 RepID=UPI001D16AB93|nr:DUF2538 family protein [Virgibacillus sp. AGTR]MCC2252153.1 DUF2538 family protein [Virgibacillus sp. AGTR]
MKSMYFVSDQHEANFRTVSMIYPASKKSREYEAACYILSVPIIFDKVEDHINDFEFPAEWILNYLYWQDEYNKEWDDHGDSLHPDHDAWIERKPYDLTNSMIQLGKLALNLWTSYDDFNLMDCLKSLDEDNIRVARCAIDLRIGFL